MWIVVAAVSFAVGLYAGERRASGMDWGTIIKEIAEGAWTRLSRPFKKGCGNGDQSRSDG